MQDSLEEIFLEGLQVNEDFFIPLFDDMEFTAADGVLQLTFDLYYIQELEDQDNSPLADNIEFNNKSN